MKEQQPQRGIKMDQLEEYQTLRKKIKQQKAIQSQFKEHLFLEKERNYLIQFLDFLKQYPKITALQIQHQEKSLKTLPKGILKRFTELENRTSKSIECCKANSQFLQTVRQSLSYNLNLTGQQKLGMQNQQTQTHHRCQQHYHEGPPSIKIINMFSHICRQYSGQEIHQQQRQTMLQVIRQFVGQFIDHNKSNYENKTINFLNIECGMGRVITQVTKLFEEKQVDSFRVQGHQEDAQYYLMSQYLLNYCKNPFKIHPYIHNFSNHLQSQTAYLTVTIQPPKRNNKTSIPLTFGSFYSLYKLHSQSWSIVVSTFYNYSVKDILYYIQVIYKLLEKGGMWIDICTSSFQKNIIPYFTYEEYESILEKSQFKCIKKFCRSQIWYPEPKKIMKQWRKVYYRIMKKQ